MKNRIVSVRNGTHLTMTHASIDIASAPAEFRDYLALADREGNNNGAVENRQEAWVAAREYCRSNSAGCGEILDFMSDRGHYFPQIPPYPDKAPPAPPHVPPLPPGYFEGFKFFHYYGSREKPKVEINYGAPTGVGFYKVRPFHADAALETFNPMLGLDFNFTERVRGSYELGYLASDNAQGFAVQSFDQKLGASYDVLHDWPERTRRNGAELHLGGGLLVKNVLISRGDTASTSVNYGGYVTAEAGLVMLWGAFSARPIEEGWTKLFVTFSTSTGDDVTDYVVIAGGKYCLEGYDEPPVRDKKKKSGR